MSRKREYTSTTRTSKKAKTTKASKPSFKRISGKSNKLVKMPYVQYQSGTIAPLVPYFVDIKGNGCYDPDAALGGHQPMGFDQVMAIYKKYYVKGSKLKVRACAITTSAASPYNNSAVMCVWADTVPYNVVDSQITTERCLAHGGRTMRISNIYSEDKYIRMGSTTKGVTEYGMDDDRASGTDGTDPELVWYWHVVIIPGTQSADVPLSLEIEIEYDTICYDAKTLIGS